MSDVHPQVSEIKEHVENVREVVCPKGADSRFLHRRAGFVIGYRTAARRRLDGRVFA